MKCGLFCDTLSMEQPDPDLSFIEKYGHYAIIGAIGLFAIGMITTLVASHLP